VVESCEGNLAYCRGRNSFAVGDEVEIIEPGKLYEAFKITEMYDENKNIIQQANHPDSIISLRVPHSLKPYSIIRKMQVGS
jgi:hypothetical protein